MEINAFIYLLMPFLIILITPILGKLILQESNKLGSFYISYIILIAVILPTSGDFAFDIRYPYFIFDLMDIHYFNYSKNGLLQSYILPMILVPVICLVMLVKYIDNTYLSPKPPKNHDDKI